MNLPCTACNGSKLSHRRATAEFTYRGSDGSTNVVPARAAYDEPCCYCEGRGEFAPPDVPAILQAIKGRGGQLRSAKPQGDRAYFVWRLARFHGGIDVTMPMNAMFCIHGDPFEKELDALAGLVAQHCFGTQFAAAARWGGLLGATRGGNGRATGASLDALNLPATAREGGPVCTVDKPECELLEMQ